MAMRPGPVAPPPDVLGLSWADWAVNFGIIRTKIAKLEASLTYRDTAEAFVDMNVLLAQVVKNKDSLSAQYLHIRILDIVLGVHNYEDAERHIAALEKVRLSNPVKPEEFPVAITALSGRAELSQAFNKLDEAVSFYKKGLILCEALNRASHEIGIYIALAKLEWGRGNAERAKSYLDKVESLGIAMKADDYLVITYGLKAEIAEKEGNFKNAFAFLKLKYRYDEKFKARSAGFDIQNYYLQLEKDQLETEKENKSLELSLKNTQLFYTLSMTALILLLAAIFIVGYYKQRQSSRKLATQNTIIQKQAEDLQSLDVAKSRFFANISHEFRTPLTVIMGMVENIQGHEKARKLIQRNSQNLLTLINQMLDLSKLENGRLVLHTIQ